MKLANKLGAEFLGTLWLVFGGAGSAVLAAGYPDLGIGFVGVSIAFGLTVLSGVYAFGHISGGHFNPAVSVGLWLGKRFDGKELIPYIIAQVLGGIVGAGILYMIASGKEGFVAGGFASNGFGEGYFGIQVNSEDKRTVLFSIWSPFKTDDPKSIPEDQKIILLKKGKDILTAEFGNEGSGGQSRFLYNWKAGNKYKFLIKVIPSVNKSTDYTAYFYAPEIGKWKLIASFRRPKTSTYLTRPHSFLENFIPSMGNVERKVNFSNQWVCDSKGKWYEMTKARFTADATARKKSRLDYAGGAKGDSFYLKNDGFFSEYTKIDTFFSRNSDNKPPEINFSALP